MYCARCFEEITVPHWHSGAPYGSTCYKIVTGEKPSKSTKYIPCEIVGTIPPPPRDGFYTRAKVVIYKGNQKKWFLTDYTFPMAYEQNGQWYVQQRAIPKGYRV